MSEDPRFEQFIELCKRAFERMERDGSWPWPEEEDEHPPPETKPITNSKNNSP